MGTYSGYTIQCEQCGQKSAEFSVDEGNLSDDELLQQSIKAINKQINDVALKNHRTHDFEFDDIWVNQKEARF